MLEAMEGVMTNASPEAWWLTESLGNSGLCHRQIGLFSGRGQSARTLLYACLDQGGRTLAVAETKSEVGEIVMIKRG